MTSQNLNGDRGKVAFWLKCKREGRTGDWQCLLNTLKYCTTDEERLTKLLQQLQWDADHSDLLFRLFSDGEIRDNA